MPEPGKTVFLSYAREDGVAVSRIAAALRNAGVEVWFDQSELRGGDAWDQKIRRQVRECALFVPVVSANTQARLEGYFRREWKWAAERTHDMAHDLAFLVPVALDGTKENGARVPEEFLKVQWVRLAERTEQELQTFAGRVGQLLGGSGNVAGGDLTPGIEHRRVRAPGLQKTFYARLVAGGITAVALLGAAFWLTRTPSSNLPSPGAAAAVPPASVAVLAFENLSDDKANEYFADGISDELLTVLQKIPGLRVTARMSAFSFKGQNATAQEIGRKLGVAYLVNGSVRKSDGSVRIVVRLDRADTGEQLWGESFQRELKDIFAVQSELAATIIGQLRSRLGGGSTALATVQAQIAAATRGGTNNTGALEAYLQGKYYAAKRTAPDLARAIDYFQNAVELDNRYAQAWAGLGSAQISSAYYGFVIHTIAELEGIQARARLAIDRSLALEPDLPEGLAAKAAILSGFEFDWKGRAATLRRALQLDPQDPNLISSAAVMLENLGRISEALGLRRKAVALDPANPSLRTGLASNYALSRRLDEAREEMMRALEFSPDITYGQAGLARYLLRQGNVGEALIEAEKEKTEWPRLTVLAMVYWRMQDTAKSDAALSRLIEGYRELDAYQVAQIYAFRGQNDPAFEWLEIAWRQRDPGLQNLRLNFDFEKIRTDPRWPAFLRKVGLADEQVKEWGW
jgi:TolB-like protein